jgi:hypothetical protein
MKFLLSLLTFVCITTSYSQEEPLKKERYTAHNKGKIYIFWGGNRESFSNSDIRFKGANYDFTVDNVEAEDKPKGWHIDYINPARMTIPQTNLRIGYFINDHYNISIGLDHMKYVFTQNQTANVSGTINLDPSETGSVFNGFYNNTPVDFTDEQFLTFEHTDGLNYITTELCRMDDVSKYIGIINTDIFQINLLEGAGGGILYPKTNAKLLGKERHDDFHVSGFGLSAKVGLNLTFFKYFFIEAELKGGYINMNDIRTTSESSDKAQQDFFFFQRIIAFGGIFRI